MSSLSPIPHQRTYDRQDMSDAMEVMAFLNMMPRHIRIGKTREGRWIIGWAKHPWNAISGDTLLEVVRGFRYENRQEILHGRS